MHEVVRRAGISEFFGVPVVVQLKGAIVGTIVRARSAVTYAKEKEPQWIPEPAGDDAGPSMAQVITGAVLEPGDGQFVVMRWQAMPNDPQKTQASGPRRLPATISTLVPMDCIGFVTRVVDVREPGLITL